jgi:hypothetical protein
MIVRAYCRCNSGHYFIGEHCPLDGWSSAESGELTAVVERLTREGKIISVEELRKAGLGRAALARLIVIEFGAEESAFDLIDPRGYVVHGEWTPIEEVNEHFV